MIEKDTMTEEQRTALERARTHCMRTRTQSIPHVLWCKRLSPEQMAYDKACREVMACHGMHGYHLSMGHTERAIYAKAQLDRALGVLMGMKEPEFTWA
jgi:hypothetical protein